MFRILLACLAVLMSVAIASARDIVILKDGRQVEGDIVREIVEAAARWMSIVRESI